MASVVLSDAEKLYIIHGVQEDLRVDGRGCEDYRCAEVETDVVSNTSGSARVKLMTAEVQFDRMVSDMEMLLRQRCGIEFLHVETIDIHCHLLNVDGDPTVDVSAVKQWVVHFISGNSDMKYKARSRWHAQLSHDEMKCLDQLICANQQV
uniref:Ribosomal RNA-processing protein 42 n=1 Tax=Gallus gallus TaxID=9031 RepID=A0A8V0YUK0_CHICK